MTEFTKVINNNTYRVKPINAIEALALKSSSNLQSFETATALFNTILEKIEVQCGDQWYPVKRGETYLPTGIENDIDTIQQLVSFFIGDYFKPLFLESNKSN